MFKFFVIVLIGLTVTGFGFSAEAVSQTGIVSITAQVLGLGGQISGGNISGIYDGNAITSSVIISGTAIPLSTISIFIEGVWMTETIANADGFFTVTVIGLQTGDQTIEIVTSGTGETRVPKMYIPIRVPENTAITIKNIILSPKEFPNENYFFADLNRDSAVTTTDFSLLAFWYEKIGFPVSFDLNNDGLITMVDFSILAYYWNE